MNARLRLVALMTILGVVAASAVSRTAQAETPQSHLTVIEKGGLFSAYGIRQADGKFAASQTNTGRQANVETMRELPEAEAAKFQKLDAKDSKTFSVHRLKSQRMPTFHGRFELCSDAGAHPDLPSFIPVQVSKQVS